MAKKPVSIYQIKVALNGIRPPIWRRIQVRGNTSLLKLHDILQVVMGWQDYHLHQFTVDGVTYGDPATDEFGEWEFEPEERHPLSQLVPGEGFRFRGVYDFGDCWEHTLLVEKITPAEKGTRYPVCLKGKRACPPEDVSGTWGYQNFLQAVGDPDHPEHGEYLAWAGGNFDLEAVNAGLRQVGVEMRSWLGGVAGPGVAPGLTTKVNTATGTDVQRRRDLRGLITLRGRSGFGEQLLPQ